MAEKETLQLILDQLEHLSGSLNDLSVDLVEHRQNTELKLQNIEGRVGAIEKDITSLLKLVRDGNGRPSLIEQVSTLSSKIDKIDEHGTKALGARLDKMDSSAEKRTGLWISLVAIAVSIVSAIRGFFD